MTGSKALRTRVYIDGFNLYYGCLKGSPYKWLDPLVLFEQHVIPPSMPPGMHAVFLPLSIKLFTALIVERAAKALDSVSSQARYHSALRKLYKDRIELVEGYYSVTEMKAKIVDGAKWPRDCEEILVWKLEEKQSDVNLALQAYHDAITGEVDQVVIVTNDTDIVPALKLIRQHTSVVVGLVIPTKQGEREPNKDLADLAHWVRVQIAEDALRNSQLPRVISGRKATLKPVSWYAHPDLLRQILELAIPVKGSSGAVFRWMEDKNPYLGDEAPINLIETRAGAERVIAYMREWIAQQASAAGIPYP